MKSEERFYSTYFLLFTIKLPCTQPCFTEKYTHTHLYTAWNTTLGWFFRSFVGMQVVQQQQPNFPSSAFPHPSLVAEPRALYESLQIMEMHALWWCNYEAGPRLDPAHSVAWIGRVELVMWVRSFGPLSSAQAWITWVSFYSYIPSVMCSLFVFVLLPNLDFPIFKYCYWVQLVQQTLWSIVVCGVTGV